MIKKEKQGKLPSLTEKIEKAGMPEHVMQCGIKRIDRYEKVPSSSAESAVIRNYIDWLIALPWSKETEDDIDIAKGRKNLK